MQSGAEAGLWRLLTSGDTVYLSCTMDRGSHQRLPLTVTSGLMVPRQFPVPIVLRYISPPPGQIKWDKWIDSGDRSILPV